MNEFEKVFSGISIMMNSLGLLIIFKFFKSFDKFWLEFCHGLPKLLLFFESRISFQKKKAFRKLCGIETIKK